jgi:hypothetical protein
MIRLGVQALTKVSIDGGVVDLNADGKLAAGLRHASPDQIIEGASTVRVGGPSLPGNVVSASEDGLRIELDNGLIIDAHGAENMTPEEFMAATLATLTTIYNTPSGKAQIDGIAKTGKQVTIVPLAEPNGYARPNFPFFLASTGHGVGSTVYWNPKFEFGPEGLSEADRAKTPGAVLFHELGHSRHNAEGNNASIGRSREDGYDNDEEYNTITGDSPSEADYMRDIGIPYKRTHHRSGPWVSNPK